MGCCLICQEEGHGCKAFTGPDMRCDVMTTSVCLLWKDVGANSPSTRAHPIVYSGYRTVQCSIIAAP